MVRKIGTSRRYEPELAGLRAIAALVVLREKVIRPLFAASQRPGPQTKANHPTPVDHHTNISGPVCAIFSQLWGLPPRIDNSFFIFSHKGLRAASLLSRRPRCQFIAAIVIGVRGVTFGPDPIGFMTGDLFVQFQP